MQIGEFGFLCKSMTIQGKHVVAYEKKEYENFDYEDVLKKTKGFVPKGRAPRRVYSCPLNYIIEGNFVSQEHIDFTVTCLSIALGVKLVSEKYSYVDSTNIKPLHLGFVEMSSAEYQYFIDNAFNFYLEHNANDINKIRIIANAIYLLFRAESQYNFPYEDFYLLYTAIDCCYKYYVEDKKFKPSKLVLQELCENVYIDKHEYDKLLSYISSIRSELVHEGTFLGSYFAHKISDEKKNEYISRGTKNFLQHLLIRLIFKMLKLDVSGFLSPFSLSQTCLHIKMT